MGKIDIEFRSKCSQCTVGCIEQGICGAIIRRSEPLPLRILQSVSAIFRCGLYGGRKKRYNPRFSQIDRSSRMSLHLWTLALSRTTKVFLRIRSESLSRKSATLSAVMFLVVENLIPIISVDHSENVESQTSFKWNIDILTAELPSVWHISLSADVAFISIINVDETIFFLLYEFLQLLGLIRIELRRGFPLWTFSYASISRAKAGKKP